MIEITRPLLRYHGGKFKLAPWIIGEFPGHRVYTESFGGAASTLLQKPRAYSEVYNDLDGEVVNLFRVVREQGQELKRRLLLTPFSREEFELSYQVSADPMEQARRTVTRSFLGFGSAAASGQKTGFRAKSNRSGTSAAQDWATYPEALDAIIERLRGVVIENKDAREVMLQHDGPDTLHYVDPPYLHDTRNSNSNAYRFEMADFEHVELLKFLLELEGMVVLSGYPSEVYTAILGEWKMIRRASLADGAADRIEVLWINPAAAKRRNQTSLFA